MDALYSVLLVIHTIIVLFLIVLVLIQRSSSDGLGGLGGGGGGNQFLTGRASANLMTRTTAILAGIFMFTSLVLAVIASDITQRSIIDTMPIEESAPAEESPVQMPVEQTPVVPKPE